MAVEARAAQPFTAFESGQVRPLALSPDGERLFAVNTPDNRLEIYAITDDGLVHEGSVPVGLEPVAVAARSAHEVWVVNHLSDSVSVVSLTPRPQVSRTLQVGDEPRDLVFAGPGGKRAFVTAAHRGQNTAFDPQLTTPGIGRADVWVFDANHPGQAPTILNLFCDTPRALAVSADGKRVYAAAFNSGNQTAVVPRG
ncbi:beta-propeller fold lactonase family protein [Pseudenhygromyxa sp. WMMC2535]|uniref:YncE family protein n=1 Tax=Pseudenhygromyxa sp. WMMC2535 TaxID=2712867 RepID=UPI0020D1AB54|nr:beta-propeller fold lactonase family protein [Pseudenhygromyxa sp. WMMC2535]